MFLEKYIDRFYFDLILDNYEESYLNTLDENNFKKIYELFKSYNFYFIDDIILNYLEIFEMDYDEVKEKLNILKEQLGYNFVYKIGNDMSYLNKILE